VAGLELVHASPGNDLAIRWDLAGNTSHVTRRRLRRSGALHLLEDVRHAFRRRGSHQMSSAMLRFGHNALRLLSKSYGNVSKDATQNRPEWLFLRGKPDCHLKDRPAALTVDCDGHNGPASARHSMSLSRSTASRSREISDERPLRAANAAATGRRLTTVSPDLKVPIRKNR
jgi:hypothetical protein